MDSDIEGDDDASTGFFISRVSANEAPTVKEQKRRQRILIMATRDNGRF